MIVAATLAQGAGKDGVFSVTEFGAIPDGKTDNTAAIQKANDPPRGPGVPPLPEGDAVLPFGVENVHFSDISLDCRKTPIQILFAEDTKVSRIRNISFSNMTIRSPEYPSFTLRKGDHVSDILLSNVRFEILPGSTKPFAIRGVERLTLDRVTFIDVDAGNQEK
ncbi:MAG: hypothetical protein PF904_00690 [Kiritimatiellae bacterium]|nr:hypothetical protein [Kiritimatiellia bacterium]